MYIPPESPRTGDAFLQRNISIPRLMLLGLLYCPSNRLMRAQRFYEIVEIELSELVARNDHELQHSVPILYEIVYVFMLKLYEKHRSPAKDEKGHELMPEKDITQFIPKQYQFDDFIRNVTGHFLDILFKHQARLQREKVIGRLSEQLFALLQPYSLRHTAFFKFKRLTAETNEEIKQILEAENEQKFNEFFDEDIHKRNCACANLFS